ncbi:MAG TPA: cobalamin-binding protein [Smithellaceae bacterium]|nr:cobalamin-binding protein [Smithellaceae bacterium]
MAIKFTRKIAVLFFCAAISVFLFSAIAVAAETATDETGRVVSITPNPQRIISLAPGITEILFALDLGAKTAGVTDFCNWPVAARRKQRVGGFVNPSVEKIIALNPDLIVATADGNRKETIEKLASAGLPVYVINPSSVSGILQSIVNLGRLTKSDKQANLLVSRLKKRLADIAERTGGKSRPRIFFQIGLDPLITVGRGTLINEAIGLAGGINIAGDTATRYPRYSKEGIIMGAPDIVLFAPMAGDKEFTAVKIFWRQFPEIPAVRNNKIYPVDTDTIGRASLRFIDAVEKITLLIHPEICQPGKSLTN